MRAVLFAAILASSCTYSASAHTCVPPRSNWHENDKKYAAKRIAGDKAFREGKYERALAEYRGSLAYQDAGGVFEVYFKLGETAAMLGNFEKAYACIIESGPAKIPASRTVILGIANPAAREAAQILSDTIQINAPRCPYGTFPEYLALAAILRHSGLASEALAAEVEGRINREAANAWDAALVERRGHASLAAADRAAMEVYEREHRPETAELLRAQAAAEPPLPRRKRSFWYLLVTASL
jgi:hypothetical protein